MKCGVERLQRSYFFADPSDATAFSRFLSSLADEADHHPFLGEMHRHRGVAGDECLKNSGGGRAPVQAGLQQKEGGIGYVSDGKFKRGAVYQVGTVEFGASFKVRPQRCL